MLVPSPADLPCANPTTSHWQVPKSPLGDHLSNEVPPTSADYVVIGSGITGSSLAYRLLERKPSAKVVLLEARDACSGASGRNGMERVVPQVGFSVFGTPSAAFTLLDYFYVHISLLLYCSLKKMHASKRG